MSREKRVRLIEKTFKDRSKIVWMTVETNERLKKIKKELRLAAMEDVLIYLLTLQDEVKKAQEERK
jgi:DNA polymerase III gamma/tau subunit